MGKSFVDHEAAYDNAPDLVEGVDLEDPFAYTQSAYLPKGQFVNNKIQFEIIAAVEKVNPSLKFGDKDEFHLTVRYVSDVETGEMAEGVINFAVGSAKKGETTKRDIAMRTVISGLADGKTYKGYYLTGGGSGYTLTKLKPI